MADSTDSLGPEDLAGLDALRELSPEELAIFARYLHPEARKDGEVLLREGSPSRDMFFLIAGEVCILRGGLPLGRLHAGTHAGELSLMTGRARSATVQAVADVELAWLTQTGFERLKQLAPSLALKIEQALIHQLGLQLTDITDRFGRLLQERSLPRRFMITVSLGERERQVPTGTPVCECLPSSVGGHPVVAALMNHKLVGLQTPLVSDVPLEPLSAGHWEGQRVLRRSAALLLLAAAARLRPKLRLTMALSVGGTQWIQAEGLDADASPLNGSGEDWQTLAAELEPVLKTLIAQEVPFHHEYWSIEEAMNFFAEAGRLEALELLDSSALSNVSLASCEDYYVISSSPLVPHAGYLSQLSIEAVHNGLVLRTAPGGTSVEALEAYADAMKGHNRWLRSLNVHSVGHLNRIAIHGEVGRLIQVAEGFHEKRLGQIADRIAAAEHPVRIVCIAGPSSSGKTTFIRRLSVQLQVNGLNPIALSLDDYYLDRELTPRDEHGEFDYEHFDALNHALLRQDLQRLITGEQVATARYDFPSGKSLPLGGPMLSLGERDVLLVEGIHGLNPGLFEPGADLSRVFRIFIQPMSSLAIDEHARINPSDLRLLRRIVRDRYSRATMAADNILRWSSVRAGESRWIFPYVDQADEIFDSSLVYELSVLKVYAERYLLEVPRNHAAYATSHRLHQMVQPFVAIYPDHVPQNSILKEFIGA